MQEQLQDIIDQQWFDNIKARVLDKNQANSMRERGKTAPMLQAQEAIHRYLSSGKKPRMPRSLMRRASKRRRSSPSQ